MDNTPKPIPWAIKEIKELEFLVNEDLEVVTMELNFVVDIKPIVELEIINLTVTANYLKQETKELFMKGKVLTSYLVKDLKSLTRRNAENVESVDLPEQLWISLFSIAFTHTRAILSRSSAGSKFSHLILPAINPEIEFKKLFGNVLIKNPSATPVEP